MPQSLVHEGSKERHSVSNNHIFCARNLQNALKEPCALEHIRASWWLKASGQASYKADRALPYPRSPRVAGQERNWLWAGMGTSKALPGRWSGFGLLKFSKDGVHTSFILCRGNLQRHLNQASSLTASLRVLRKVGF